MCCSEWRGGGVAAESAPAQTFDVNDVSAIGMAAHEADTSGLPPRVVGPLRLLAVAKRRSITEAAAMSERAGLMLDGDQVLVRLSLRPPLQSILKRLALLEQSSAEDVAADAEREALLQSISATELSAGARVAALGGRVDGALRDHSAIKAWIPIDALGAIAAHPGVVVVEPPEGPHELTISQGVSGMNGGAWQAGGIGGAGVRVGIIDSGFLGFTALLGSELPLASNVQTWDFARNVADVEINSIHGTACAEIVHDTAPQARLYLARVYDVIDLQEATDWMIANGVHVISSSVSWWGAAGDGTGPFSDVVATAASNGIAWVNSAGNSRLRHWQGAFRDTSGNTTHEFPATAFHSSTEVEVFGDSAFSPYSFYVFGPGVTLKAWLRWSDWTNVNSDLKMCIARTGNGGLPPEGWACMTSLSAFNRPQTGTPGETPWESVQAVTFDHPQSEPNARYGIVIFRDTGTAPIDLDLFVETSFPGQERIQHGVSASSLWGAPADSPDAITVGAVNSTNFLPESYSSEGPTLGPGGVLIGGAPKPDISGYDLVATTTYPSFPGTSAAAPHVAGALAVLRSFHPEASRNDLVRMLEHQAIDIETPGHDMRTGRGRLHLGAWPSDFDGDGILDDGDGSAVAGDGRCMGGVSAGCDDNCPVFANTLQGDIGGLGNGSSPNGIGDDCECGDVTADGLVTIADATLVRRATLTPPTATMARPDLCDVGGSVGCSQADEAIIRRALLAPPTATIAPQCAPAHPSFP